MNHGEMSASLQGQAIQSKHQSYAKHGMFSKQSRPLFVNNEFQPRFQESQLKSGNLAPQSQPALSSYILPSRPFDDSLIPRLRESDATHIPRFQSQALSKSAMRYPEQKVSLYKTGTKMPIFSKKRGLGDRDDWDQDRLFVTQKSFAGQPNSPIGFNKERSHFQANDDGLLAEERSTSKPHIYPNGIRNPTKSRIDPANTFGQVVFNSSAPLKIDRTEPAQKNDIHVSLQTVKGKLDDFMFASKDNIANDIAKHMADQAAEHMNFRDEATALPTAISNPFGYIPSQSIPMPQEITDFIKSQQGRPQIVQEISERYRTVYFAVNRKLFVWDYSSQVQSSVQMSSLLQRGRVIDAPKLGYITFETPITAVKELSCTNLKSQIASFAVEDSLLLLVATETNIRLVIASKSDSHSLKVQEAGVQPITFSNDPTCRVSAITEFQKCGRVFLGLSDGKVLDVNFKQKSSLLIFGTKKTLEVQEKEVKFFQSIVNKVIPTFFSTLKQVKQLEVDEQRNLLYALSTQMNGRDKGQAIIQIYDLGILGDKMDCLATIYQCQLIEKLMRFLRREFSGQINELSASYHITGISPLFISESIANQLVVITSHGDRIFLKFDEQKRQQADDVSALQREQTGLQNDCLIETRPSIKDWEVTACISLPNAFQLPESHQVQERYQRPFKEHVLQRSKLALHDSQILRSFACNHRQGLLVGQLVGEEADSIFILQKNDSMPSRDKENCLQQFQSMQLIPSPNYAMNGKETILGIQPGKSVGKPDILAMLGLLKVREPPVWGRSNLAIQAYTAFNELDIQMFVHNKVTILTDSRLVEMSQIRPIDNLFMLLCELTRSPNHRAEISCDIEDMILKYSATEVCSMLICILVDREATYNVSCRVEEILKIKQRLNSMTNDPQLHNQSYIDRGRGTQMFRTGQQVNQDRFNRSHSPLNRAAPTDFFESDEAWQRLAVFDLNGRQEVFQHSASKEIRDRAWELLMSLGDQLEPNGTSRHLALYLFLGRLLKPVWELNAVTRPSMGSYDDLRSNFDLVVPIKSKLDGLFDFISQNASYLQGLTGWATNMNLDDQDVIGRAERQSLNELKAFINRCLDVIQFMHIINDPDTLVAIQQGMTPQDLADFSTLEFHAMLVPESNDLVKNVLKNVIKSACAGTDQPVATLQQNLKQVEQLCQTFFVEGDERLFQGETLLMQAKEVKDKAQKKILVEKSVQHLLTNPAKVKLEDVIPLLMEQGNFTLVVEICLRQAAALNVQQQAQQIDEIYTIIVSLFFAIKRAIEPNPDEQKKDETFVCDKHYKMFSHFLKRVQDKSQLAPLADKLVNLIKTQHASQPILPHIFRAFLLRGLSFDNVSDRLDPHELVRNAHEFFEAKALANQLTVGQFTQIERLLPKKKAICELAKMTLKVVSDTVTLKVDAKSGQSKELADFILTCEERRNKVKTVLKDLQNQMNQQQDTFEANVQQRQMDVGQRIKELNDCLKTLDNQLAAIASANEKIKAFGQVPTARKAQIQGRDFDAEKTKLQQFVQLCNTKMLGTKELSSLATEHRLFDLSASLLLQVPMNQIPSEQLYKKVSLQLREWIKELKTINGENRDGFIQQLCTGIRKVFIHEAPDAHKLLKIEIYKLANQQFQPKQEELSQAQPNPLVSMLMAELGIKGYELVELERPSNSHQKIVKILTTIKAWVASVDKGESQKTDFMEHGRRVIDQVLRKEVAGFLEIKRLELQTQQAEALDKALKEVLELTQAKYEQYWPRSISVGAQLDQREKRNPEQQRPVQPVLMPSPVIQRQPVHEVAQKQPSRRMRSFSPKDDVFMQMAQSAQAKQQAKPREVSLIQMKRDSEGKN